MASLAHAIRVFQSGVLSADEFFVQVNRVLAADQAPPARLIETLDQEHAKRPLPPDVYTEVHRRIEQLERSEQGATEGETCVQTRPGDHLLPKGTSAAIGPDGRIESEPERMKGVGDVLNGRFVLEECIGFGGMGTVYKALDRRKQEASDRMPYIAIKVLNVQFRGHPKSLIALQREARKAQTLAHPNIVAVYDFDRDGPMVYLTMEYLKGKPLSRTLRMPDFKGMPFAEAMRIVTGMGNALAYAHERGFVHCDFKPANVILTDAGKVKVIDFGIARVFQKPEEETDVTVFDPGSLGALTPAYASPEMLEHREPDPRDDIYALACITYELLTGRHPFDRLPATQAAMSGIKPPQPKDLSSRQWRALRAALSFDRGSRTPTVARFLEGLSGKRWPTVSPALVVSSVVSALVVAAGFSIYWRAKIGDGAPPDAPTAATQSAPPTIPVAPPATSPVAPPTAPVAGTLSLPAVSRVLEGVPCSALAPSIKDQVVQVRGYVSKSFGAQRLKQALGKVPGAASVSLDVAEVNSNDCGVLQLLGRYWLSNLQAGRPASIRTSKGSTELAEGDPLIVELTTPAYDSYVNVDYYVLDGNVVHLVPSIRARKNQAPPNYAATIGGLGNWVISRPFGSELVVLLTTPVPLFDGLRPESESRAGYLRAVEKQLAQIGAKHGPGKIAVDLVQIKTSGRKP